MQTHVVVVGAGAAGLAAACAAAERGARVTLLEKLGALHGTTSRAVGSVAAAGTRVQRAAGIADSAEAFAEDMVLAHPQAPQTKPLREMLAREAGSTVDWLERIGVVFVGPFPEPPNRVPRMHNAVPAGHVYLNVMARRARKLGVQLRFGARATGLRKQDGRIAGVVYDRDGEQAELAASAVVLAAGDYSASQEMRERHLSPAAAAAIPINRASTGDGHRLAAEAGAALVGMDGVLGPQLRFAAFDASTWVHALPEWRWLYRVGAAVLMHAPAAVLGIVAKPLLMAHMSPSDGFLQAGAVIVDATGERVGESGAPARELALRPGATGYVVGNDALARRFERYPNFVSTAPGIAFAYFPDYERGRPDLVHWADDAAALACSLGLDAERLARATAQLPGRLFALGPCNAMLTVTEGGAAIDASCRVLDAEGAPIHGLYAAGGNGQSGLVLKGHGLHLAWAITSGRIAGTSAANHSA